MINGKVVPAGGEPEAEDDEEEEDDENDDETEDGSAGELPGAYWESYSSPKFGELSVIQGLVAPNVYRRFFTQISAEESVLQMTTKPAPRRLGGIITEPSHRSASALVEIPAIHELLRHEKGLADTYPEEND
ncbi:hypothetical protein B0H14DRAFT_3781628 [Mycena olivaceomarginata]|nr:hypothetical protein B0H14DRAFT_3781628 [Mycena olivaceomarginata]